MTFDYFVWTSLFCTFEKLQSTSIGEDLGHAQTTRPQQKGGQQPSTSCPSPSRPSNVVAGFINAHERGDGDRMGNSRPLPFPHPGNIQSLGQGFPNLRSLELEHPRESANSSDSPPSQAGKQLCSLRCFCCCPPYSVGPPLPFLISHDTLFCLGHDRSSLWKELCAE